LAAALVAAAAGSAQAAAPPALVTVTTAGVPANETTAQNGASLSSDGNLVAFVSASPSLVPGDTNGVADVFVRDVAAGTTTLVSAGIGGPANGASSNARISANGRYVVFSSLASNLVPGDTNGASDVFERDLQTGQTTLVSASAAGAQGNGPSGEAPSDISADGAEVSFSSAASNLVPGDTNGIRDVFVWTRGTGAVDRVSVAGDGTQAAAGASGASAISADGRYVAFTSTAPNLVPGDTNLAMDVFVHDRVTGATVRASVTSTGGQAATSSSLVPGALSGNGQVVVFDTSAPLDPADTGGDDVYVRDLAAGTTERVSVNTAGAGANGNSSAATISTDGRFVSFESSATNLDPADTGGDEDVFVRDRVAGVTQLVSTSTWPLQISQSADISGDGQFVALTTTAPDVVPGDTAASYGQGWDVIRFPSGFDPPVDQTAPSISCASDDGSWHGANVSLACTATDAGSGLADPTQASFVLTTSVPAGTETATAVTNAVQVCDQAGNCATAGPVGGIRVDRLAPQIAITSPTDGASFALGSSAAAAFSCTDGGSGVATCTGSVPDGAPLDTSSAGQHTFTVQAADAAGNTASATVTYSVVSAGYQWLGWSWPYASDHVNRDEAGRTIPLGFLIRGAAPRNLVAGVWVAPVACGGNAAALPGDPSSQTADWQGPWSLPDGRTMLLWRTSRSYAGSCRQVLLQLTDGSIHRLLFDFRGSGGCSGAHHDDHDRGAGRHRHGDHGHGHGF
jgi:Tol biopolymer transport system component